MGSLTGEHFIVLLVLAAVVIFFLRRRSNASSSAQTVARPSVVASNPQPVPKAESRKSIEDQASELLEKDGTSPSSILRCIIQTGDGSGADFLDGRVGSYHGGKFLRIVIQIDESNDPRGYWRYWDVPWSQLVEIILRNRTTPQVGTNTRQPDGTYGLKGPYAQTRLYKIGRGIECRLLNFDEDDMESGAPFEWLKRNLKDSEIRFASDTQENPLYGDTANGGDRLDGYVLHSKSRQQLAHDEESSHGALQLSKENLAALTAASSEEIRDYLMSQRFVDDMERRFGYLKDAEGGPIPRWCVNYAKRVIELTLVRAIPYEYYELFFFRNFPNPGAGAHALNGNVKNQLLDGVRLILMHFTELHR